MTPDVRHRPLPPPSASKKRKKRYSTGPQHKRRHNRKEERRQIRGLSSHPPQYDTDHMSDEEESESDT